MTYPQIICILLLQVAHHQICGLLRTMLRQDQAAMLQYWDENEKLDQLNLTTAMNETTTFTSQIPLGNKLALLGRGRTKRDTRFEGCMHVSIYYSVFKSKRARPHGTLFRAFQLFNSIFHSITYGKLLYMSRFNIELIIMHTTQG